MDLYCLSERVQEKVNKDQLIAKQQLKIEEYEEILKKNAEVKEALISCFYSIGEPFDDNSWTFNSDQKIWSHNVVELIKEIEAIGEELPF